MVSGFRFLSSRKTGAFRKGILVAIPLIALGAYAVHEASGYSYGIIGQSKAGCSLGGSCHGAQSSNTVVKISTSATQILAGQTYLFQISVANSSEAGAGCDISVDNSAKLAVSGSDLQLASNELTHISPRAFTGDSAVWTFKYTAPTKTGTAHIYAAGNAVNLDGAADAQDHWNTITYTVNVVAPSGPEISSPTAVRDTVLRGDSMTTSFWIKDTGNATLNIDHYGLRIGTYFSIVDSSAHSIAAGDSAQVTYRFIPGSGTTYTDSLHVYSNAELSPISSTGLIGVSTSGAFNVSANPVNFGPVGVGRSDTISVTLKNTGTGQLSISPQSLTFSNSNFTLVSLQPAVTPPFEVAPKGTVVAKIAFTPMVDGHDTATLPLTVSDYNGNSFDTSIVLIGTGAAAVVDQTTTVNSSLLIYPNPSQGEFNLSSSGLTGTADIEVTDPAGRIVAQEEITLGSQSSINLSELPNGTYFLAVKPKDGQSFVRRIVVQKK